MVVDDDQIKIVAVCSLNPCTFIYCFLQVRVLLKSFKRKFYYNAYLLALIASQGEHKQLVAWVIFYCDSDINSQNLIHRVLKDNTICSCTHLPNCVCAFEYPVSSVSLT